LYYGHKIFTRSTGAPFVETLKLENSNFNYFNDNFVLKIQNGSDKKTRVSSAKIWIDGVLVVVPSDFSKNESFITKQLSGLTPESILEVKLYSTPGSFIDLWIEGTIKEGTITDIDGNYYHTVKICDQWWMVENLKTTKYNNGNSIDYPGIDNTAWQKNTTGAYAWFNNDETNKDIHGALYNWSTVVTGILCPTGWHVPTDEEWHQLVLFLDPDAIMNDQDITRWESLIAGGKLKEEGTLHWKNPNYGATNESGFTALPGGVRNTDGSFRDVDGLGSWWTSTEYVDNPVEAWPRFMGYGDINVGRNPQSKKDGLSIRCLKGK
jgi:uncharacterized protein (TIGR02145 family)